MILSGGQTGHGLKYGKTEDLRMTGVSLKRISTIDGAVIGQLRGQGIKYYTLEDAAYQIPKGSYWIQKHYSRKFKRTVLLLKNVPGRSQIEIHPGNTKEDSKGCLLIGQRASKMAVYNSREALAELLILLPETSVLTIS